MLKLLIVDDSVFSQKILANLIKKYIDEVDFSFAANGKEGLEIYKDIQPDYVFLDLLMPEMTGQELIHLLKAYDPAAKIFVISADVQKTVQEELKAYQIISFINKPFSDEKAQLVCNVLKERL